MPSTLLMALARGRSARTGESSRHELNEIRLLQPGTPPIPSAADVHQAALESDFLEVIGRCPKDRWRPRMRPFGIKSVTPRPDALTVRIAAEFLPDIIHDIAPAWRAEEEKDGEIINMSGIPGIRALHRRGRTVLTRPGIPGRIVIPVPADRWRKAVMVAAELWQYEGGTCSPWFTHPPRVASGGDPLGSGLGPNVTRRTAGSTATPGSRPISCGACRACARRPGPTITTCGSTGSPTSAASSSLGPQILFSTRASSVLRRILGFLALVLNLAGVLLALALGCLRLVLCLLSHTHDRLLFVM
jgi:hypothetical protein